ncbi:trans-sulfuration enzyme family protein [Sporomusa acidovorans]|uniref:L-methionine gamma-lyase n=1 Tax=Sporomusa acidovorans (strain ATCC 49682 / DSM 3132 / Mol) TaxID=1123286 RepID=A0ABZ3J5H8_SPOA4|nr:PLP-dependent aspartate aminotransferase family protein [Sporomusa acidovorans]OZC24261.1 cystathionine gamma-lyase [Sporomusa acidovorans DSM 3132]SDF03703.1 methionine-gamma-lyase [Sporomusa acidovorans]
MMSNELTRATHILYTGGESKLPIERPETPPIYHSTANIIRDMDDYDFASNGGKYYYCRTANPNRDGVAEAVSYLEKGEQSLVCSSGMAAISTAVLSLIKAGDHIVASRSIYGETIELFDNILKKLNVEVTYSDFTNIDSVRESLKPNTKILYTEIIANPLIEVVDIDALSELAHGIGALVLVDSTFTTPLAIRPLEHGADIVIHSLTKYFGGHSDITAGSITGSKKLMKKIYSDFLLLGGCLDPNSAWLMLRSIRTMEMRVTKQFENARKIAEALQADPHVRYVNYPTLPNHPQRELAAKLMPNGCGAMLSFRVEDDRNKVNAFMHKLKLVKYLGTLGGYRTTIAHPATAFRNEFTPQKLKEMGMEEGLIRISAGAEAVEDLIADFKQALTVFENV